MLRLEAVSDIGDLGLDPLHAVPHGRLEVGLHGEHIVRGDPTLALQLGIIRALEPVFLTGRSVEIVRLGPIVT